MSDFFTLIKDNKEVISAIVIVSGGVGFFLNYFLARKKINEDRKSVRQQMITNNIAPMRQQWINDLRKKTSRLFAVIDILSSYKLAVQIKNHSFTTAFKKTFETALVEQKELTTYLQMALPFSRNDHKEDISDIIRNHLKTIDTELQYKGVWDKNKSDEILDMVTCCANNFKVLFKNEWNETKSLKEIDEKKHEVIKLPPEECTCSLKK
ncbi:TPA: hypothetical protein ACRRWX_003139 [Morganella morganii]